MYKLTDYAISVEITGLDEILGEGNKVIGHKPGYLLVTYNNGPQSRFALKPSKANRLHIKNAVLFCARGQVLDAIERVQRLKDGEPAWLQAAKEADKKPRFLPHL